MRRDCLFMSVFISLPSFLTAIKTLIRQHFTVIIRYALLYFRPHSHILHEHVPYGDDVANGAGEDEEMEYAVHVAALVEAVEQGACDVEHALGHNPPYGGGTNVVYKRLECHEHAKAHAYVAHRLYVAVFPEPPETHNGACQRARPYKHKQAPAPQAFMPQGDERERRVAAGYVPVDGGMVELSEPFLCAAVAFGHGVIYGRRYVRREHACQI